MGEHTMDTVKNSIKDFTAQLSDHSYRYPHFRQSSVLVPLIIRNGEVFLLLTKRSKKLRTHPGAVAFPGGVKESDDESDVETAVRETEEEIGLKRENVLVIGILPPLFASPMTTVVPVVGILKEEFIPTLNHDEVDDILYVPLELFASINGETRVWSFLERDVNVFFFEWEHRGETEFIYGLTAMISMVVLAIIINKPHIFPPLFASDSQATMEETIREYYQFVGEQTQSKSVEFNTNTSKL